MRFTSKHKKLLFPIIPITIALAIILTLIIKTTFYNELNITIEGPSISQTCQNSTSDNILNYSPIQNYYSQFSHYLDNELNIQEFKRLSSKSSTSTETITYTYIGTYNYDEAFTIDIIVSEDYADNCTLKMSTTINRTSSKKKNDEYLKSISDFYTYINDWASNYQKENPIPEPQSLNATNNQQNLSIQKTYSLSLQNIKTDVKYTLIDEIYGTSNMEYILNNLTVYNNKFYYTNIEVGILFELNMDNGNINKIFNFEEIELPVEKQFWEALKYSVEGDYIYVWDLSYMTPSNLFRVNINNPKDFEEIQLIEYAKADSAIIELETVNNKLLFTTLTGDGGDVWGYTYSYNLTNSEETELVDYGSSLGIGRDYITTTDKYIYYTDSNCLTGKDLPYPNSADYCHDTESYENYTYVDTLYELDKTTEKVSIAKDWTYEDKIISVAITNNDDIVYVKNNNNIIVENKYGKKLKSITIVGNNDIDNSCYVTQYVDSNILIGCKSESHMLNASTWEITDADLTMQNTVDIYNNKLQLDKFHYELVLEETD